MKTIMIKDEVYNKLSKIKGKHSFSELLDGMVGEQRGAKLAALMKIKGILTEKKAKEAHKRIKKTRENFSVVDYETSS